MQCPNCGIPVPADQRLCRACGLKLPESSDLLAEQMATPHDDLQVQKRKNENRRLRLWTSAGAVFYVALFWAIISQIIIGKGHVLAGILFLLVITAISLGGLLILYSSAVRKRGGPSRERSASPPAELKTSVTEQTTESLE